MWSATGRPGGPVGLVAAMESRLRGAEVTVFEARPSEYTRGNVLKLDNDTMRVLRRAGLGHVLQDEEGKVVAPSVREVEKAAMARAVQLGVQYVRGQGVTGVDRDDDTGEVVVTLSKGSARADLLIVAVGPGVNKPSKAAPNIVMSDMLGISFTVLDSEDHAAVGVFAKDDDPGTTEDRLGPKAKRGLQGTAESGGEWVVVLEGTGGVHYRLATVTPERFQEFQKDREKLRAFLLDRAPDHPRLAGLTLDPSTAGQLQIKLQRADRTASPEMRSVLVGDSVSTPHPLQGSGVNAGLAQIGAIGDLVEEMVNRARGRQRVGDEDYTSCDEEVQGVGGRNTHKGLEAMASSWGLRAEQLLVALRKGLTESEAAMSHVGDLYKAEADAAREGLDAIEPHRLAVKAIGRDGNKPAKARDGAGVRLQRMTELLQSLLSATGGLADAVEHIRATSQGVVDVLQALALPIPQSLQPKPPVDTDAI